jgi:hypothetical protein
VVVPSIKPLGRNATPVFLPPPGAVELVVAGQHEMRHVLVGEDLRLGVENVALGVIVVIVGVYDRFHRKAYNV